MLPSNRIKFTYCLPVVFYRCETWSLTSREEHRLRVFENRVLRKPQNEEFNELYCSSNSSSDKIENEMGGACGMYEREEMCIQGSGGET